MHEIKSFTKSYSLESLFFWTESRRTLFKLLVLPLLAYPVPRQRLQAAVH